MGTRRGAVAALLGVAIAAGLQTYTWRPTTVYATVPPPDSIATYAGGIGSGAATLIGQQPNGVAVHGNTLYVADDLFDVVRAVDLTTLQETVVAGGSPAPGCTEPCPATSAFIFPQGIGTDAAGNLYITDFGQTLNGVVRKVDLSGTISTFAGGGIGCTEPCPATQSRTMTPDDVTADGAGNVYFADFGDSRVRKVDGSGNITTIAGTGVAGYTGNGGLATSATLNGPTGVAIDASGNVYISDFNNFVVRRVDHLTGNISTYAGGGGGCTEPCAATSAFLNHPFGLRLDSTGNLYISDRDDPKIRKVDTSAMITTYAGASGGGPLGDGGLATLAHLQSPMAVALDGSGNLFIADFYSMRVRRVDHLSLKISTFAGMGGQCGPAGDGGQALSAQICQPSGLTFDSGDNLYFTDVLDGLIRKITPAGVVSTVAGGGAGCSEPCAATLASLNKPNGVAVDSSGNLFIADTYDQKIREVDHLSGNISTIAGTGVAGLGGDGALATLAQLQYPNGVAVDALGNVYIADTTNQRVRKVDHISLFISTIAGTGTSGFSGDNGPGTAAQLNSPVSVAVDGSGNVYISDSANSRIRKLTSGTITTYAGGGGLACPVSPSNGDGLPAICASIPFPQQITVDSAGRLFIADGHVRVVSSDGYVSTLAGCDWTIDPNCPFRFVEGGLATNASIGGNAVAVDSNHNTFIGGTGGPPIGWFIFRVQAPLTPAAPTSVTATARDGQVSVSWTGGAANGNQVYRYTVTPYSGVTPLTPIQVTGVPLPTSTTFRIANGAAYTFKVNATNAFGSSPMSAASNAVVPSAAPPGDINTHAGYVGFGAAKAVGQVPYSLAVAANGLHVFIGDSANGIVRDVNVGTGQEGVLAGQAAFGYTGNGGAAASALISGASAMVTCGTDTYFADVLNYVIRKVDNSGNISVVAGTGQPGWSGDGGPGTAAQISRVFGLACRNGGGLYISDSDNGAVRILDASGNIRTWWYGFFFPTGIVEAGALDVVDVSDSAFNVVVGLTDGTANLVAGTGVAGFSGDGGGAASAMLSDPRGLAWDNSWLFIADRGNNRVRAVVSLGQIINTIAGTGTAGYSGDNGDPTLAQLKQPTNLAIDTSTGLCQHALYITDLGNFRVRAIDGEQCSNTYHITTVAGNGTRSWSGDGGPATAAQLGNPFAIAIDAAGNQYIADNQNSAIRKIDLTGIITTVAGTGVDGFSNDGTLATAAHLSDPRGVAVNSSGDIFISDTGNQRIRKVDHLTGTIATIAGTGTAGYSGDLGPGTSAQINSPRSLAVDAAGNVYIADTANNVVRKVTPGGTISTFAGTGTAGFSGDSGPANAAMLNAPKGLAVDASGNVYVTDSGNQRVRKVDHVTGSIATIAGNGLVGLVGDGKAATVAELNAPLGIGLDPAGSGQLQPAHQDGRHERDHHDCGRELCERLGLLGRWSTRR